MTAKYTIAAAVALAAAATTQPALAGGNPDLSITGDIRLRAEQDWGSRNTAGVKRLERTRARVRFRVNGKIDLGDGFAAGARARSAGVDSQQNANVTFADFDGNPDDSLKVNLDRYSLAWKGKSTGIEAGRMAFPFFTANEYFWDADISALGFAANTTVALSPKAKLKLSGGGFALPVGVSHFSGKLFAGQAVVDAGPATIAAGVFRFDADRADSDRLLLLDNNGARDYTVLAVNGQYKTKAAGRPLQVNADFYQNLEGYDRATDAVTVANRKRRTGYVLGAVWGETAKPGHFQLGYRWSWMEKLAVNASYAHDDLARFGTAAQAALTDLKGHDLYANVAVTKRLAVGARAMFVERISNREDGKRARLDVIYAF